MGLTIDDLMAAPLFGANRHILEYDELVYAIPRNLTKEDLSAKLSDLPHGMREVTPVERTLDLYESTSSMKQESPGFSRGECQHAAGLPLLRERIIRCKDCKFYDEVIHACDHPNITALRGDVPINYILTCFDEDFCCWAKPRRDDGLDAYC